MHAPGVTLSLYPPFSNAEDLSDTLFKLAFQARPYGDRVREVRIWRIFSPLSAIASRLLPRP